jgi:hypothetical protein
MKVLGVVNALCLAGLLAWCGASARAASAPPVVSGRVSSNGDTAACVNDQHSGVTPSSPSGGGSAVQLADSSCRTAAPTGGSRQTGSARASHSQAQAGAVTAANAVGLRIASIRIDRRGIATARRVRLLVTVRDQAKHVIRYAVISVGCPRGARGVTGCTQSTYSNRLGQAAFQLRLGKQASGRRLSIAVTARTPTTRVRKLVTVRLPKLTTRT